MSASVLDGHVREHARLVDETIARFLPRSRQPLPGSLREYLHRPEGGAERAFHIHAPMRHVLEAGGKRLRPTLCLLAHEAAGGHVEDALATAAGIEFLHTFTLVHDDIMDRAETRRSRPTVGALWGDDVAITAGDALFALAFDAMAANADVQQVGPERVLRVVRRASQVCIDLAQGQSLDLLLARRDDVTVEEYLEMSRLKTGSLLAFSLEAGAILAGASPARVRQLAAFGEPLGLAFQIRDDLLDLTGDAARLGKPVAGDLRTGKRTLMVAHAFERSARARRLAQILDSGATHAAAADEALGILEEAGSLQFAQAAAEEQLVRAREALHALPRGSKAVAALEELAEYVLRRQE